MTWLALVCLVAPSVGAQSPKTLLFLTDFGVRDGAVAVCKAVMWSIAPDLRIVDLTHENPAYDVATAGEVLEQAVPFYPSGTVVVVVVDPGVGSERKPIAVRTKAGHVLVGPDNGVFTLIMDAEGVDRAVELRNRRYFREATTSFTFHGRDIFSPVGAHLANGTPLDSLGPPVVPQRLPVRAARISGARVEGVVRYIEDPYGNVVTNIPAALLDSVAHVGDSLDVGIGTRRLRLPWRSTFSDVKVGAPLVVIHSRGLVSFSLNQADFAKRYGARRGDTVVLTRVSRHQPERRILLRTGRLLDVVSGTSTRDAIIAVQNGRITAADGRIRPAPGDSVIDLSRYTVLPGLIDTHVHLAIGGQPRDNALADLNAGFTTIVDLGSRSTRMLRIRDSIDAGLIPGPRVLASGIWVGRKDGVCEFNGIGIAGGPDAFRARVRENVDAGADVIKACVSGWPADAFARPADYEMPDSVLSAVVDEAHRLKRRVIAHDISAGGVAAAIRAGVDGLAHAAFVDSAAARALATRGMFMIPTLATLGGDDSEASRALRQSVLLAHRAGVRLVFGTDGGVLPHGQNAREFQALASAGIPLIDALRAATINSARSFALSDSVGTIERGKLADIIAVDGDPTTDASALSRVCFVMSRGRVVRLDRSP